MKQALFSAFTGAAAQALVLLALVTVTGCDFGNKTQTVDRSGEEEGTHMEGDNANDQKKDTTGTSAFQ